MEPPTTEHEPLTAAHETSGQRRDDLVGRAEALAVLGEMFAEVGCVAIVGPPGVGKTRLAAEYAKRRAKTADATWLQVDLTGLADVDTCWSKLAASAGIEANSARAVAETLSASRIEGVVIDGVEALGDAGSLLVTLRHKAPTVRLLVTSRRRVRQSGAEHLRLEGLETEAAVLLFQTCARGGVVEADRPAVMELVGRLDGLPLPIKLAAARTEVMSPAMMLARLDRQFEIFGASSQHNQESFEQSIGRSWTALEQAERVCLMHCSVFGDSFTLDAAESVVELPREVGSAGTIEILSRLLDASWLKSVPTPDGQTRFEWWESLRIFARGRLEHTEQVEKNYVDFFRAQSLQLSNALETPSGLEAVEQMRWETPHLLRAVDLCLDTNPTSAAEIMWALRWNARLGDGSDEIGRRLERVSTALDASTAPGWAARIDMLLGETALRGGRTDTASDHLERALARANSTDDLVLQAQVARSSSMALAHLDLNAAEHRLREALIVAGKCSDRTVEGGIRERLGFLQLQTFRLEEARHSFRRARKLLSTYGNALLAAQATTGLAYVALRTGHRTAAASAFEETVQMYAKIRDRAREAEARFNLGVALHADGKLDRACEEFERALDLWDRCNECRYETIAHTRLGLALAELEAGRAATQSFREAVTAGHRDGDWHNRAIAEANLVMLELLDEGLTARITELEQAIEQMHFAGDPDAAGAALGVLAVLQAARRQPEAVADTLQRILALRSLVASQDTHLLRVIDGLLTLAHHWADELLSRHQLSMAPAGLSALRDDDLVRYVPSLFHDDQQALAEAKRLFNPYLRLLFSGFINQRSASSDAPEYLTQARPESASTTFTVHRDGHWFQIDDEAAVDLLSRQPLRRMLRAIITSHLEDDAPGRSVDQLIEQGWPDEVLTRSAGSNRVYTGIRSLRDMGLDAILVTDDAGYRFAEEVAVLLSDESIDSAQS